MDTVAARPTVILFLVSDTGAGHRRAAEAIAVALESRWPGEFRAVLADPLAGPGSSRLMRLLARSYGPVIRRTQWAWGVAYHVSNWRPAAAVLSRTVFRSAQRAAVAGARATRASVIVSCHPLTSAAASAAAAWHPGARQDPVPVVTVVTDLASAHASWFCPPGDVVALPSEAAAARAQAAGVPAGSRVLTGLPVAPAFAERPAASAGWPARAARRRSLGLPPERFTVVLAGGGEGCGGLARRARAVLRAQADAQVVVLCGRNQRLERRLSTVAASSQCGGRLTVLGFTEAVSAWLSCADVLVTKAGPGSISEAACCGVPMLLTAQLPGQEHGNAALTERAGAGLQARTVRRMVRELRRLRADPAQLLRMSAASRSLARPSAAADIAGLIAVAAGRPARAETDRSRAAGRPASLPLRPHGIAASAGRRSLS